MKISAIVITLLNLTISPLMAHRDPRGEIRPSFFMAEGKLKVLYHVNAPGDRSKYKVAEVLRGTIGTALEISESMVTGITAVSPPGTWIFRDRTTFVFGAEHAGKPCIFRLMENRPTLIVPKWKAEKENLGAAHSFAVTSKHFVFLVGKMSDNFLRYGDLHLYLFDRESLDLAHHLHVGDAVGIMQEPTYSRLVEAGNTVFFCWSKPNDEKPPSLVMAEVPPSGKLREHTIRKDFHWNAVVDMAAIDDDVFVVYDIPDSDNANSTIHLYQHNGGEPDGGGQPSTGPESK